MIYIQSNAAEHSINVLQVHRIKFPASLSLFQIHILLQVLLNLLNLLRAQALGLLECRVEGRVGVWFELLRLNTFSLSIDFFGNHSGQLLLQEHSILALLNRCRLSHVG